MYNVETLFFTCIKSEEGESRKSLVELVFCTVDDLIPIYTMRHKFSNFSLDLQIAYWYENEVKQNI